MATPDSSNSASLDDGVRIRDLTVLDLDAATRINQANVPAVGSADEAHLAHLLGQATLSLAVERDEVLAGFCIVLGPGADYGSVNYRWFSERYESFAYLDRVAIDAAHQSRGLGGALYGEVERRLAGSVPWFLLEVNLRPRNDGSLRFHARQGFVEVGQQDTNYGTLVSLLAKPLA